MMNMMKAGAKGEKNKILISCQTEAKEAAEQSLAESDDFVTSSDASVVHLCIIMSRVCFQSKAGYRN